MIHCLEKASYTREDQEELLDIVSQLGVRSVPTPETIEDQLARMGKCELVNKPMWACTAFRRGIADNTLKKPLWDDSTDVDSFYDQLAVSAQKLAKVLIVDDNLTKSQNTVFSFLCRYIKACDDKKIRVLCRFLQVQMSLL